MLTIKMLDTNETREVTANVAHGLVEAGKAEIVRSKWYETREMRTSPTVEVTRPSSVAEKASKSSKRRLASKTYKSK